MINLVEGSNTRTLTGRHRTRDVHHDDRQRTTENRRTTRERRHQLKLAKDDDRLVVGDEVTNTQDGTGHRQTEHTEEVHEARGSLQTHDNQPRDDHAKHASNRRSNQGQDGRIHHRIVTDTREHVLEVLESEGIVNAQDRDECTHNNRRVNRHNEKCQRGSHCAQRNASGKRSHHANAASGLTGHGHR